MSILVKYRTISSSFSVDLCRPRPLVFLVYASVFPFLCTPRLTPLTPHPPPTRRDPILNRFHDKFLRTKSHVVPCRFFRWTMAEYLWFSTSFPQNKCVLNIKKYIVNGIFLYFLVCYLPLNVYDSLFNIPYLTHFEYDPDPHPFPSLFRFLPLVQPRPQKTSPPHK